MPAPKVPDGYRLLSKDELKTYKFKVGDKVTDDPVYGWTTVNSWRGNTIESIYNNKGIEILYCAVKGKEKPRFKTKHKYPYGY
jgi:hypothetical protein